ncbi:MAG: hypothetical protein ACKKMP_03525 [Candidatus Nealsonbacteria bacterium]
MTKTIALKNPLILSLVLILSLMVIYVIQVGVLARDKYLVRVYKKELVSLSKNNKFLDIDFSKMNSLSHIDQVLAKNSGFVKTNNVKYIKIIESSIARP